MARLSLTVTNYRVRSLNELLRGGHPAKRAAVRRRELENLGLLIWAENGMPDRALTGPLHVRFCILYCGPKPDVDGRWKLVGDALQHRWIVDDGDIEELTCTRERVARRTDVGFRVEIEEMN